ncbi:hypothetical protein ACFQH3_20665 [Haladaptatus sp. GCM10025707]|uniref:hypothetical protein n=1 Tax=unclassified Haladaptatus TaxID=2622732 RepID=UPI0023E81F2E|nr:hypothetical protein [Haladaptatus sp. QDMS2]
MFRGLIAFVASMFGEAVKIAKWPFNPTNGKGQYVTPSNRHFLTGKVNLVVTIGYRLGQAGVNFGKALVFDVLAPLVDAIIGIASDLYHSNPNYTRMALRGGFSAVQTTFAVGVGGLMLIAGLFRK